MMGEVVEMVREAVCGGRPSSMAGGVLALSLGLNKVLVHRNGAADLYGGVRRCKIRVRNNDIDSP